MIGIYRYTNLINGKRYIGQAIDLEERHNEHIYSVLNNRPGQMIEYAMVKYGIENFRYEIIEYCSKEELNDLEIYWIDYYNTQNNRRDGLGYGYNLTKGGSYIPNSRKKKTQAPWNKGKTNVYSEDQLKRISDRTKVGMHKPESWNKFLNSKTDYSGENNPFYGKKHSIETLQKISINRKGKLHKSETKELFSKQRKGRKWVNNGIIECFIKPEEFDNYINIGYCLGRLPKVINKISNKSKNKHRIYNEDGSWMLAKLQKYENEE